MKVTDLLQPLISLLGDARERKAGAPHSAGPSPDALWVREYRETAALLPDLRMDEIFRAKIEVHNDVLENSVDIDAVLNALLHEL